MKVTKVKKKTNPPAMHRRIAETRRRNAEVRAKVKSFIQDNEPGDAIVIKDVDIPQATNIINTQVQEYASFGQHIRVAIRRLSKGEVGAWIMEKGSDKIDPDLPVYGE
jgi:hypothetical protein